MSDEEIVLKRLKETLDVLEGKNVIGHIDFQIRNMVEDCIRIIEKQKEKNKRLRKCHLQYEEMTGIDLLLPEKEE